MSEIRQVRIAPTEIRHLAPGEEVTPHRHTEHQLIYASSGVLEVFVPDGTWFTPSVRAVWVPSGTAHHWQVHGTTTVHMVGIPVSAAPVSDDVPRLVAVDPLFRELVIACSGAGPAETPAERRMLRVLLDRIDPSSIAPTVLPTVHDPRLRDAQQILGADPASAPDLAELGRSVGASERTLSRLFSSELGMSYPTWRTQLRLHRAVLLLAEGRSVTSVASACGFSSPSAFISSFRAAFGRTPGSLYRA